MPDLVPVDHNPFQKMVPVEHDPFEAAAARTQQSVRPEGGRQEGAATKVLAGYVPHALGGLASLPERAFGASEQLRTTGEYDPGPAVETAMLTLGAGTAFAPKGAVGMAGGKLAGGGPNAFLDQMAKKYGAETDMAAWSQAERVTYDGMIGGQGAKPLVERIVDAYADVRGGKFNGRARLADIRAKLPDVPAHELDAALKKMQQEGGAQLYQMDNRAELTAADRSAALKIGEEPRHILWIERRPSPKLTPVTHDPFKK